LINIITNFSFSSFSLPSFALAGGIHLAMPDHNTNKRRRRQEQQLQQCDSHHRDKDLYPPWTQPSLY
jgi:hypothetical protein